MTSLTIKQTTFGEGAPKICVPITGTTEEEILSAAEEIRFLPCEVAEWRTDYYQEVRQPSRVMDILAKLRTILNRQLLLFTFRTAKEGGQTALSSYDYLWLNQKAAESGLPDLIDIEFSSGAERVETFVRFAHRNDCHVIVSCHNFEETPPAAAMTSLLLSMQKTKADLVKLAVTPKKKQDVLALLEATAEVSSSGSCPVITMSMGKGGQISRLAGEAFGSVMTFGCYGEESAPGQLNAIDLSIALQILHR